MAATAKSARAVALFIDEAWDAIVQGRYPQVVAAGERAVRAAEQLDDPALLVRALEVTEVGLLALGDSTGALARCTRILTLAEDAAIAPRLTGRAAQSVGQAYVDWVDAALNLTGIPWRDLFGVLDAADRWLVATGHTDWRAAVLHTRALVYRRLGDLPAAIAAAEESLAAYRPGIPGTSVSGHRISLADYLRYAGRGSESVPYYQAVLDDPDSSSHARALAHIGLAYCAMDTDHPDDRAAMRRHAATAVSLGEHLGEDMMCVALDVSAEAYRQCADLDTAWQTATHHLEVAARVGGHYRPYYATKTAVDIALDRGELDTARQLLADLDKHAAALDAAAGSTTRADDTAYRHRRLARLAADIS
ncbi:hypothetical protein [Phytohabitans houttuyneae]|uniref:MalT-like TPR region domain-containing protein n=1 Tax=Phytohabitans houttuyneae TaxID=1076126 RepID=A0A6V8KS76_9ACTN|nr:hypothetical protein [Phytohabitans houttuyneae]GFJ86270.1 hypothetical protein Phou_104500 [Phytohabitans houttuyneae]